MTRVLPTMSLALLLLTTAATSASPPPIQTIRVPNGGLQPQALVDRDGGLHLIYLTGDPDAADICYHRFAAPRKGDAAAAGGLPMFGAPIPVNSHPGSAIAIGTIRGPHMALGRDKRVHVAWMGSAAAEPKAPGKHAPMLYARLRPGQNQFDPQRNVVTNFVGLDGGGSVAADGRNNVYVAWHAPLLPKSDESTRRVFVTRSTDNGDTFSPEQPVTEDGQGVCACCGIKLLSSSSGWGGGGGTVVALFRTAREKVHRDAQAVLFQGTLDWRWDGTLDPAESATCMMSTFALAEARWRRRFAAAWESPGGKIRFGLYSYRSLETGEAHDVPAAEKDCKHPAIAIDRAGNVLVAWAEGTGWNRGGAVAWQLFDADLNPIDDAAARGRAEGLPAWSKPAVVALPAEDRDDDDDVGGFAIFY